MNAIQKYDCYLANKKKIQKLKIITNKIEQINLDISNMTTFSHYFSLYGLTILGFAILMIFPENERADAILPFYFGAFSMVLISDFICCKYNNQYRSFNLLFLKIKETDEKVFKAANKKKVYQEKMNVVLNYINILEDYNCEIKKSFNLSDIDSLMKTDKISKEDMSVIYSLADYNGIIIKNKKNLLFAGNEKEPTLEISGL